MEKKQTAVEWLEEQFQKYTDWIEGDVNATEYSLTQLCSDFEKAKEMEREQIEDAYYDGQSLDAKSVTGQMIIDNSISYYNEIYGKENDRS